MVQKKYQKLCGNLYKIRSEKIIKIKKKKIYHKKNIGDIVGINIKPEFPKNPDIVINNSFKKSINFLSKELVNKIKKTI